MIFYTIVALLFALTTIPILADGASTPQAEAKPLPTEIVDLVKSEQFEQAILQLTDYATLGMDFLSSKLTHCRSTRYIDD